jgi:hypothetical protein
VKRGHSQTKTTTEGVGGIWNYILWALSVGVAGLLAGMYSTLPRRC